MPQWIKDAGEKVITAFVDAAVAGDGWCQKGFRSYATVSQGLADDMAELFLKLGGSPSVTRVQRDGWSIEGRRRPTSSRSSGCVRTIAAVRQRSMGSAESSWQNSFPMWDVSIARLYPMAR